MKKFFSLFFCTLLLVSLLAGCGSSAGSVSTAGSSSSAGQSGDSGEHSKLLQKCLDQGYITIGTGNDVPFAFIDEASGEAKGIEVDITKEAMLQKKQTPIRTAANARVVCTFSSRHLIR